MPTTIPDWLYNFLNSGEFYIVLVAWLLVCIAWKSRRDAMAKRLVDLISKPTIFEKDGEPGSIRAYPRRFLETVAGAFQKALTRPLIGISEGSKGWLRGLVDLIYNKETPWRTFGYILFLMLMSVFILSDAIAIANALDVGGWLPAALPSILQRYEVAAAMGSLFAIITGVFVFSEINRKVSVFTDWDRQEGPWKNIGRAMSMFMVVIGFVVVALFGLRRIGAMGIISTPNLTNTAMDIAVLIIIPINTVVATALIAEEGIKGLLVVVIALLVLVIGALYLLGYLLFLLGYVFPFTLDVVWRVFLFIAFVVGYLLITPIDWLVWILSFPFKVLNKNKTK